MAAGAAACRCRGGGGARPGDAQGGAIRTARPMRGLRGRRRVLVCRRGFRARGGRIADAGTNRIGGRIRRPPRLGLELEMRRPFLLGLDRFGLALARGVDERPDLVGEGIGVEAGHATVSTPSPSCLLAEQLPEEAAAALRLHVRGRRRQLRNGVGLDVLRAGQRAQEGDELLFVARRKERRREGGRRESWRSAPPRRRHASRRGSRSAWTCSRTMRLRMVA